MISVQQRNPDPKLNIITRIGLSIGGPQPNNLIQSSDVLVRRPDAKKPVFDVQKEKEAFMQARSEFCTGETSTSTLPLRSNGPPIEIMRSDEESQGPTITIDREHTDVLRIFLQNCLKLIKNEHVMAEL